MKIKLVTDSSSNICQKITQDISYVPMKVITDQKEYIDTPELDVPQMLTELRAYKGTSSTACPNVQDWYDAFGDSDIVYGVALTSKISGGYNSSIIAAEDYVEQNPNAKVFMLDSLTTGPELELLLEGYQTLIEQGYEFDEICEKIKDYVKHTHLIFSLKSLDNFAKNGRVNPVIAKAIGVLGLQILGKASDEGTLEPMHKCRGEKKAMVQLLSMMKELGYKGGKVRIAHSYNQNAADTFAKALREEFPKCDLTITYNRGLCCYYAEEGSLLVAFEDDICK